MLTNICKKIVLNKMRQLPIQYLANENAFVFNQQTTASKVYINNDRFFVNLLLHGSNGAALSYINQHWHTDNLLSIIEMFASNSKLFKTFEHGSNPLVYPFRKLKGYFEQNTVKQAKKNIADHYDLGNDLYKLFLDPTMMYSCAIYPREDASLTEASLYKLKTIGDKLQLQPEHSVLEIGSGWGGLSIYLAKNYGCKVTTTTISKQQYEYVCAKVQAEHLNDKITVLFEDYRKLQGKFDRLVSIEMIEAVGHKFFPQYFKKCNELLHDHGLFLLQAITIREQDYEYSRKKLDFIKQFIFPGGCLPSLAKITDCVARFTSFRVCDVHDISLHYAKTLSAWHQNFMDNLDKVQVLGLNQEFINMWELYLKYCEGGYRQHALGNYQLLLAKNEF